MANETYLGDGVYASVDEAGQIVLRTTRSGIALEPEVLCELITFVHKIGWGEVIEEGVRGGKGEPRRYQTTRRQNWQVSDADYTRAEEDAERKRDAASYDGD